jgi:hypothetical protein
LKNIGEIFYKNTGCYNNNKKREDNNPHMTIKISYCSEKKVSKEIKDRKRPSSLQIVNILK